MTISPLRALLILVCGSIVLIISFGTRTSFGLFLAPVSTDLGWGREVFAFALALQNLVWGVAQPFAGAIADRYGSGKVVAACGALYALGLYLMANTASPGDITLSAGILIGIALSGTGFPIILAVVGRSVSANRRSLFLGIASAAGSSGQLLVVPLGQAFINEYGWVTALVLLAVISLTVVPLAVALVGRPGQHADGAAAREQSLGEAVREAGVHTGYWYLTAGFFVCGFHVSFVGTHFPAFIVDNGLPPSLGAAALAVIGLGNVFGSLMWSTMGGRYRKKYVLSTLYLLRAILFVVFLFVPITETSVLVFSVAMGFLWLGTVPVTGALVAEIFGLRYMATLFGFVFFSHQVGSFLGAWLGGYFYDTTGSYDIVWWMAAVLGLVSALLHAPINDRPMRRLATT